MRNGRRSGARPTRLRAMVLPLLLAGSPALACNDGDRLTDYMEAWLLSSDDARGIVIAEFEESLKTGGFHIEGLKTKYKVYFGKRPGPLGELSKCSDDKIISALDLAIKRTHEVESAN